jgi:hypothetical protein
MVLEWLKSKPKGLLSNATKSVGNFAKGIFDKGTSVVNKVGNFAKENAENIGKVAGMALDSGLIPGGSLIKAGVKGLAKVTGNETLNKISSGLRGKKFKGSSSEPTPTESNGPPKSKAQGLLGNVNKSVGNFAKGAFDKGKSVVTKVGNFAKDNAESIGKVGVWHWIQV